MPKRTPWASVPQPSDKELKESVFDLLAMMADVLHIYRNTWMSTDQVFDVLATKWYNFHPDCEQREKIKFRCIIIANKIKPALAYPYDRSVKMQVRTFSNGNVLWRLKIGPHKVFRMRDSYSHLSLD